MNASQWMDHARKEIGICEIAGIKHTDRIIQYHACTGLRARTDETPWCASFICWVLSQAGIYHPRSAAAHAFLAWGDEIYTPRYGAVAILERGPGLAHVTFVYSDTPKTINGLGGNQGNRVGVVPFSKDKLLGYRWPKAEYFNAG